MCTIYIVKITDPVMYAHKYNLVCLRSINIQKVDSILFSDEDDNVQRETRHIEGKHNIKETMLSLYFYVLTVARLFQCCTSSS